MTDFLNRWHALPEHLMASPLPAIGLTLVTFLIGMRLFVTMGRPVWCPPVLIASVLLAAALAALGIDIEDYQHGAAWLMLLLGPATVALGVPLYQQIHHVRAMWKPILICLPLAASLAALYAVAIAWALGGSHDTVASLAPKSVTAPIALGIIAQIGGSAGLLLGALLVTGVLATLSVSLLVRGLGIDDERLIGFTLGLNGHAIGTVRAFEISPLAGAFASLGMSLTGLFTAIVLPIVWRLAF
ncbi:LrgB family protein [Halomonas shantousis]